MKSSKRQASSGRSLVFLMLAALLLLALVFVGFGARIDRLIAESVHHRIEEYASQQRTYISTVLESRYALLDAFAEYFSTEPLNSQSTFNRLSRSLMQAGDFDHVLVIDKDGGYRISSGESGHGSDSFGRQLLLSEPRSISRPFRAFYHNNEQCVLLSVPLTDADGAPAGMLCASYTTQRFARMLLEESYREDSFSMLTDAQGNLLFSSSRDHLFIPDQETAEDLRVVPSSTFFSEEEAQAVRASMALRENNLYTIEHSGVGYVIVQTPLDQNNWILFCMLPTDSLAADYTAITQLRHLQLLVVCLILSATAMALIAGLLRSHRALRRENTMLSVRAKTDSMTGLLNQATTSSTISSELRINADGLLLLIDLDDLKGINDTLGHPIGDRAILILSGLMQEIFTQAKVIGRIGGDEFMIYLSSPGPREEVRRQILNMQEEMQRTMAQIAGQEAGVSLRCSVGAAYARPGDDYDSLYRRADIALYHVKRHGKDGCAFFSDTKNL